MISAAEHAPRVAVAKLSDLPEIRSMVQASPDGPQWPDKAWESLMEAIPSAGQQRVAFVLRNSAEKVAGWITGTAFGEVAELEFLLVAPDQRRTGLGRLLLAAWTQEVKKAGVSEALLEVRASNHVAARLYAEAGFVVQGHRRGYYSRPVEDAVLMRLLL